MNDRQTVIDQAIDRRDILAKAKCCKRKRFFVCYGSSVLSVT